ncbi:hypothetical protein [Nonomuraea dietziae]|uniref:hypothetical protein n=1 Tax=Nonomuraea dietziae TaxID=65515 RepID=UPI0031E0B8D8
MRRPAPALAALAALTALWLPACAAPSKGSASREAGPLTGVRSFTYVLTGYPGGRLDAVAAAPHELAIVDLSRDATAPGYFSAAEIAEVRKSGQEGAGLLSRSARWRSSARSSRRCPPISG